MKKINRKSCHTSLRNETCLLLRALSLMQWCQWKDILPCQSVAGHVADSSPRVSYLFAQLIALKAEHKQQTVDFFKLFL